MRPAMIALRALALLLVAASAACDGETLAETASPGAGAAPPLGCAPGETTGAEGECSPAGVPAAACGPGFTPDGASGCAAVLPADPCPPGWVAVPGETTCREVEPCGDGPWGLLPLEPDAQHVDGSYDGGDSDGTLARPFTTIQDGIDAAAPGTLVAVTDGTYDETVAVFGKAVRLRGRCPATTILRGTGSSLWAALVKSAHGTEIRGLSVTGPTGGIVISGSENVVVERTWLHETGGFGLAVTDGPLPSKVVVRDVLVETTGDGGILAAGSDVTLERCAVRDTSGGWGLEVDPTVGHTVRTTGCVLERNAGAAVAVIGASLEMDATLVRDGLPGGGFEGLGVVAQADWGESEARATLAIRRSVIERVGGLGILLEGSDGLVEASVVREVRPEADGSFGSGVVVRKGGSATVRTTLLDRCAQDGLSVIGSTATVESAIVRATEPNADGAFGEGIGVAADSSGGGAAVTVDASIVEGNHTAGIVAIGAEVTLDRTVVRSTLPDGAGQFGRGVNLQMLADLALPSHATIRGCLFDDNRDSALAVLDSSATCDGSTLRGTLPDGAGAFGDGIVVAAWLGQASLSLVDSEVESNVRAGLLVAGGSAAIEATSFRCNGFDLEGEAWEGAAFALDDRGETTCGCPEATGACKVLSAGLEPPVMLP